MKQIFRYVGLLSGSVGGLFILFGLIGKLYRDFLGVLYYANWFWFANTFILFAVFCMLAVLACKDKNDK